MTSPSSKVIIIVFRNCGRQLSKVDSMDFLSVKRFSLFKCVRSLKMKHL